MPFTLPYSDAEFLLARNVVNSAVINGQQGRSIMSPHNPDSMHLKLASETWQIEQAWLDRQVTEIHTRQPKILYSVYESLNELQAAAVQPKAEDVGFITVSYHLILHLCLYFNSVLSHPAFLPEFGNSDVETWPRIQKDNELNFAPIDPARRMVAGHLTNMATRFVTAHEMSHLMHGHLRSGLFGSSVQALDEVVRTASKDNGITSQTLEMDADSTAIQEYVVDLFVPDANGKPSLPFVSLRLLLFAVYSFFRILHGSRTHLPNETDSHPPPMVRLRMIVAKLAVYFNLHGLTKESEVLKLCWEKTVEEGERAYLVFVAAPRTTGTYLPISEAHAAAEHVSKLLKHWQILRPILEPLSRSAGKLAL